MRAVRAGAGQQLSAQAIGVKASNRASATSCRPVHPAPCPTASSSTRCLNHAARRSLPGPLHSVGRQPAKQASGSQLMPLVQPVSQVALQTHRLDYTHRRASRVCRLEVPHLHRVNHSGTNQVLEPPRRRVETHILIPLTLQQLAHNHISLQPGVVGNGLGGAANRALNDLNSHLQPSDNKHGRVPGGPSRTAVGCLPSLRG